MNHVTARHPFALPGFGLVAVALTLWTAAPAPAGTVELEPVLPLAAFAQKAPGDRRPVYAFATEKGVYELDANKKSVRVWPRDAKAGELVGSRLRGVDSAGAGSAFGNPVSLRKKPGANLFAVVDACPSVPGLGQYSRIAFYSFSETLSGGVLSSVTFTLQGEIVDEALANATDVSFFPTGNKIAASVSVYSSSSTDGDEGAIRIYSGMNAEEAENSFFCVRTKNVYEGASHFNSVGAEPFNVPVTSVFVDPVDPTRLWAGSENFNAILGYDPVEGEVYDETITIRTWEYNWTDGFGYTYEYFDGATADYVQGAVGVTNLYDEAAGFNAGSLGQAGATNTLLSSPGFFTIWNSPVGKLLVVPETEAGDIAGFDEMGNRRFTFDASDRIAAMFSTPRGVWISDDGAEMVVADTGNGRVEIFSITEDLTKPDETVGVDFSAEWYCETDGPGFTNWLVAAAASLTNRSYSIEFSVDPDGSVAVEPAVVEIPAGADRAPFVLRPLDGVAGGTRGTLTVAGQSFDFLVTNSPPTVRTGPRTEAPVDDQSWMYADEGLFNDPLEYVWGMMAPETFRVIVLSGGSGINFHAKAFDVDADADLAYEWRIVGTEHLLALGVLQKTDLADLPSDPIYDWTPVYYYEYEEGVPPTVKTKIFTAAEAEAMPKDGDGNPLCIEVHTNLQVAAETWVTTNVLNYAEITNWYDPDGFGYEEKQMINWPPILFDDERNGRFLVSDTTLYGADATFEGAESGVLYFAILTVTDKDGGTWNSLEAGSGAFFAFTTGPEAPPPPSGEAVYAAVFTEISATNLSFDVTWSGDPAPGDTVTLESAKDYVNGPWTAFGEAFDVGTPAAGGESTIKINVTPIDTDEVHFYRIVRP